MKQLKQWKREIVKLPYKTSCIFLFHLHWLCSLQLFIHGTSKTPFFVASGHSNCCMPFSKSFKLQDIILNLREPKLTNRISLRETNREICPSLNGINCTSQLCVSHGQPGSLVGEPSTLGEVQLAEGFLDTFALLLRWARLCGLAVSWNFSLHPDRPPETSANLSCASRLHNFGTVWI